MKAHIRGLSGSLKSSKPASKKAQPAVAPVGNGELEATGLLLKTIRAAGFKKVAIFNLSTAMKATACRYESNSVLLIIYSNGLVLELKGFENTTSKVTAIAGITTAKGFNRFYNQWLVKTSNMLLKGVANLDKAKSKIVL